MSAGDDAAAASAGAGQCERGEIAVGWVLHALEPEDERLLLEHLPQCAECRRTLREAREVTSLLAVSVPALDPPPDLRGRVLAAARDVGDAAGEAGGEPVEWSVLALAEPTSPPGKESARRGTQRPRRSPGRVGTNGSGPAGSRPAPPPAAPRKQSPLSGVSGRGLAIVVGAFVLVVGLVIGGRSVSTPPDAPPVLAQRADQVVGDAETRDPGVRTATLRLQTGTPVAVVLDNGSGPRVVPLGLPPLRPDHAYWLWRLGTGPSSPAAVGSLGVDGLVPTESSPPTEGAASAVAAYAISSEPSGSVPPRPTAVVALGQFV